MSNSMLPKIITRQKRKEELERINAGQLRKGEIKISRKKTLEEVQKLMAPKPKDYIQVGSSLRSRLTQNHKKLSEAANSRSLAKITNDKNNVNKLMQIGS